MKFINNTFKLLIFILTSLAFSQKESSKRVILKAEQNDTIFKRVLLQELKNEFYSDVFLDKTKSESLDIDVEFYLETPKLFRFYSLEPQTAPLIVFIQPGDSVYYKLSANNLLLFEGKNASHYNFFTKVSDESFYYPQYDVNESIWKYKEKVDLIYEKKMLAFTEYIDNNFVSDLFKRRVKDVLYYEYLNLLVAKFRIPTEAMIGNQGYLESIDFKLLERNDQEDNFYFYLALMNYLNFNTIINQSSETDSKKKLIFQLNFIDSKLRDNNREYAITKTLLEYELILKPENIIFFLKILDDYLFQIKEIRYKNALEKIKQKILILGLKLPQQVLSAILMDIEGNPITLKEILEKREDKIKVIDFWASWCAPCISEIKTSHEFRNKISEEKKLDFLYFSIDEDHIKWKKKVSQLIEFGMDKNQYLLTKEANSILKSYFTISSIPRYVLLNDKNETIIGTIPPPNDSGEFENVVNQLLKYK